MTETQKNEKRSQKDLILELEKLRKELVELKEENKNQKHLLNELKLKNHAIDSYLYGIAISDLESNIHYVNKSWLQMNGYNDLIEVKGKSALEFFKYPEQVIKALNGLKLKGSWSGLLEAKRKNGSIYNLQLSAKIVNNENGEPVSIIASGVDITEQKNSKKKLIESERRLKAFSEVVNEAIFFSDKGICIETNEAAIKMFGYSRHELIGKFATEIIAPESQEIVKKNVISNYDKPYDAIAIRKDGSTFSAEITGRLFNYHEKQIRVTSFKDITVRKKAEIELINKEKHFKALIENSKDVISILDKNAKSIYRSPSYEKILGYKIDEVDDNFKFMHPDDVERTKKKLQYVFSNPGVTIDYNYRYLHKDGIYRHIEGVAQNLLNVPEVRGIVLHYKDVSKVKKAEEKLLKLYAAVQQSQSVIAITDLKGNLEYVNPRFTELTGYSLDEAIGQNTRILKGDYQDNKMFEELWKTLESGKNWHGEFNNKKKNGKYFWESASISPIYNEQRKKINYVKVAEDITEKKTIEEELQKMSKLKSVGTLAGGIAHDFNNILTGIYGNISLAKMEMSEEHPGYRYLNKTERSINRATKLTKQLLTFSKGGSPITKEVDLSKLIEETITFDLSGSNVKPVFNFEDDLMNAIIDEGQIQQVFSNLAINADQASPEGGHLYLSVENSFVQKNEIVKLEPGRYLKTTIQDEGTGIEKKYLDKVFDPYFTTKQSGSGLGLTTTYSIIQKHNGHLQIASEIGTGTTFTIYLPGIISQNSKEEKTLQPSATEMNNSAKILIMDDEEVIRTLSSEMFYLMGYQTETAPDGSKTIDKYKEAMESGNPFDLIIMDLTIPGGMGGDETIKHILKIDPDAKVIVSSGYSSNTSMTDHHENGFKGVISKPYTFKDLKEKVHKVLSED